MAQVSVELPPVTAAQLPLGGGSVHRRRRPWSAVQVRHQRQHALMRRLIYNSSSSSSAGNNKRSAASCSNNPQDQPKEKLSKHERGMESPTKGNINNAMLLVRNLVQHFNHRDQSDITVRVRSNRFYLHKILLARSEVFRAMMLGQYWDDSRQQEIELQESDECVPHMEAFFKYFYTAEISLSRDNVVPLLILSNKYNVKDLEDAAERFANKLVFSGTPTDVVIEWWHLAAQLDLKLLHKKCKDYLLLNMDSVLVSGHFTELSVEYLEVLLRERDMVVRSEYTLYKALLRWLQHESHLTNLAANLKMLLPLVKFTQMSGDELLQVEASLEQEPELWRKHMIPYLYTAFKFHAVPFHTRATTAGLAHLDSPRLYTNARLPKVGAMLRLHPYEREQLSTGVTHNVSIPVSLSNADRDNVKNWHLVFHEVDDRIQLEICSALCNAEQFDLVEASVLIYKQINGITFVKGVMQFRCCLKNMPDVPCGHVFNVLLPKESLDANSPYLISGEAGDYCQFCIVWRHYHGDVFHAAPAAAATPAAQSSDSSQATPSPTTSSCPSGVAAQQQHQQQQQHAPGSTFGVPTNSPHTANLLPSQDSDVENLSPNSR